MVTETPISSGTQNTGVSDETLKQVIADFLAMGHVENIVAMVKQTPEYLQWTGELLTDERFSLRLGLAVLFEHLIIECPDQLHRAVPSLAKKLEHETDWVRGEAASLLGTIGSEEAIRLLADLKDDPSPQVVEIVDDLLAAANG